MDVLRSIGLFLVAALAEIGGAWFPRHQPIAPLATLIEAEQSCCAFLAFTLHVGTDTITLDLTGPDDAELIIHALVGAPA